MPSHTENICFAYAWFVFTWTLERICTPVKIPLFSFLFYFILFFFSCPTLPVFSEFSQGFIRKYYFETLLHTVVTAFFMSTETHAKRFLTVWKRSVSTTLKRSFTVLANQIIVSKTFQAFQILTNHISVRKTLSWKPCLVSNVLAFAELANQNPADSIYFTSFFFFFFFFFFFSNFT